MKVPTQKELEDKLASEENANLIDLPTPEDQYREYLEEQREILAEIILSCRPLFETDRLEIAYILNPALLDSKPKRHRGRPRKKPLDLDDDSPSSRDFRMMLEYEAAYSKGMYKKVMKELEDRYALEKSGIKKALARVRKWRKKWCK